MYPVRGYSVKRDLIDIFTMRDMTTVPSQLPSWKIMHGTLRFI